jgi:hypothetical protein
MASPQRSSETIRHNGAEIETYVDGDGPALTFPRAFWIYTMVRRNTLR